MSIMNVKPYAIECLEELLPGRVYRLMGGATSETAPAPGHRKPAELLKRAAPGNWRTPALGLVANRAGDFWETLTYITIWVCGWSGIGFCLL